MLTFHFRFCVLPIDEPAGSGDLLERDFTTDVTSCDYYHKLNWIWWELCQGSSSLGTLWLFYTNQTRKRVWPEQSDAKTSLVPTSSICRTISGGVKTFLWRWYRRHFVCWCLYSRKDATYCVVCSVQTNRKPPLRTIRAVISLLEQNKIKIFFHDW